MAGFEEGLNYQCVAMWNGSSEGRRWRCVSHCKDVFLSITANKARVLMGAAAIKMRGQNQSTARQREKRNYSSAVQITAGRLSGSSAIMIMTTWCDMIVTALKENHLLECGKR